jgi:hypothetical protein
MRILLAIAVLPSVAAADKLTAHVSDGTNLHMAGNRGAMHWDKDIGITLDLATGGKASLSSTGSRKDHALDGGPSSRNTDEIWTWTTKWTGTWAKTGDKLVVDLVLANHNCKHERKMTEFDTARGLWVEYTPEQLPCQTALKQAKLSCSTATLQVGDLGKTQPRSAWVCNATANTDLAETPAYLVFGKTACIDVHEGRMTMMSYGPCKP